MDVWSKSIILRVLKREKKSLQLIATSSKTEKHTKKISRMWSKLEKKCETSQNKVFCKGGKGKWDCHLNSTESNIPVSLKIHQSLSKASRISSTRLPFWRTPTDASENMWWRKTITDKLIAKRYTPMNN